MINQSEIIRPSAEQTFAHELEILARLDRHPKPQQWKLSPWAVLQYILGAKLEDGTVISSKYLGQKKIIEMSIATLLSDRALLLTGYPGTAKTWLSEHLTAAISGDSSLIIQGTSGTHEDLIKYGWNYASLIAKGPTREGLIPSPIMKSMELGTIARIEELSRIPTETQDALISLLSEKVISIPELNLKIEAKRGFNIIATSNDLDRGIYEMSSALKRRFNIISMPMPQSIEEEVEIITFRVNQLGRMLEIPLAELKKQQIQKLTTLFRELREGKTMDGKNKLKPSNTLLSPAVAISIVHEARIFSYYFSNNKLEEEHLANGMINALNQEGHEEVNLLQEYNETVLKKRSEYKEWYNTFKKMIGTLSLNLAMISISVFIL